MRGLWIVLAVFVMLLLGWGIKNLRRENVYLQSRVQRVETDMRAQTRNLQSRVTAERQRLETLRQSLAAVTNLGVQPPTGSVDAHISDLARRISTLETQIRGLNGQTQTVHTESRVYQQQNQAVGVDRQLQLRAQIDAVNDELSVLKNQTDQSNPVLARQDELMLERERLNNEIQTLTSETAGRNLSAAQSANSEQVAIENERRDAETQLSDLRQDLTYWQSLRAGEAAVAQPARVRELKVLIQAQEARLNEIEEEIKRR